MRSVTSSDRARVHTINLRFQSKNEVAKVPRFIVPKPGRYIGPLVRWRRKRFSYFRSSHQLFHFPSFVYLHFIRHTWHPQNFRSNERERERRVPSE